MADYTAKHIDDIEAIYWGAFKRVRADLGIESFGVQVIDLPPGADTYPEHDHADDGQEELYAALGGAPPGTLKRSRSVRARPSWKRWSRNGSWYAGRLAPGGNSCTATSARAGPLVVIRTLMNSRWPRRTDRRLVDARRRRTGAWW